MTNQSYSIYCLWHWDVLNHKGASKNSTRHRNASSLLAIVTQVRLVYAFILFASILYRNCLSIHLFHALTCLYVLLEHGFSARGHLLRDSSLQLHALYALDWRAMSSSASVALMQQSVAVKRGEHIAFRHFLTVVID